ncbi:ABC transporter ATP-binding protein [Brevibacillus antibioticus]|uniref:ABC transporter ATP-binding protein n=1 Tax=Brevibacillus antibioticus TaxID=2570228 RepID=A0A4U2Y545_9BACL|nr:ABC transporter ATP-binding protein [Brevibacillus antibioticus]TKI54822.1 ABC transporter ATP-binding protein [Brevibacillus antibioticus]
MSFHNVKRILAPFAKEKVLVVFSVLAGVLAALLNISRPILLGKIISELVEGSYYNAMWQWYIALYFLTWLLTWSISFLLDYLAARVSQNILINFRLNILRHFIRLPFLESEKMPPGRLGMYATSDLPNWSNLYGIVLAQVVHAISQFIGAAIALSSLDAKLTLYLVPFLVVSLLIPILSSRKMIGLSKSAQDGISSVMEDVSSLSQGIRDLISFQAGKWAMDRYKKSCETAYKAVIKRDLAQSGLRIVSGATEIVAYVLILIVGSGLVERKELGVGELVAFLATIELIFFPARYANSLFSQIQYSVASAKRVWEFIDLHEDKTIIPHANGVQMSSVSFTYPGATKKTLDNINLDVQAGKLIAVVGESGSGKSTLLQIIAGLYKPTDGNVNYLKGANTPICCAWQDPHLFHSTVSDNLSLGQSFQLDELRNVAISVNVDHMVMNLPNRYDDQVINRGENFSGGERRRLSLVRALVRQPEFLILDEPTAGLDSENARIVWQSILELGPDVTKVISTHQMEEARQADLIIVLKEGKVIRSGSPKDLIGEHGHYAILT